MCTDLEITLKETVISDYKKGYVIINDIPYTIKELADLVEEVSDLQNTLITLLNKKVKED